MRSFEGKSVLVTGATRGQGLAEARLFAEHGANVALCGRLERKGDEAARRLAEDGLSVRYFALDVASRDGWDDALAKVVAWTGRLDVLVNNAGIICRTTLANCRDEDWQNTLAVNLTGAFLGIQTASAIMRRNGGGAIVNIGSNAAYSAHVDPAYTASKWGIRGLTKAAAMEFAHQHIRVNCVCPGIVKTEINRGGRHVDIMAALTPMGTIAEVDDIARAVAFLASDDARMITGEELIVDGGFTAGAAYRRVAVETGIYEA